MVALVSGFGLGLLDTSAHQQNGAGVMGRASFGQANGSSYVNLATGNLVVQYLDETLSGTGSDMYQLRTYNSQGSKTDSDSDQWRFLGEKKVTLNGALNTSGSSVTRTSGDGHATTYTWNGTAYVSSEGDGASDTIIKVGAEWKWLDGSTKAEEYYSASTGWIARSRDTSGNGFDYSFANNRLTRVTDVNSQQTTHFSYNSSGLLQNISTAASPTASAYKEVYYTHDAQKRLTKVVTDLSEHADNAIVDGDLFTTEYTYKGNTFLVESIKQTGVPIVSFTYDGSSSASRVKTVTDQNGTTTFTYNSDNTEVKKGDGSITKYTYYTSTKNIRYVDTLSSSRTVLERLSYTYDSRDNVLTVTDLTNNRITYTYDANDNLKSETDKLGNKVDYDYDNNLLVSKTQYAKNSAGVVSAEETTRWIYDSSSRLRFSVSAEGRVTEHRYNSHGLVVKTYEYAAAKYNMSGLDKEDRLTLTNLTTWQSNLSSSSKANAELTEYVYDPLGNVDKQIKYGALDSSGDGIADSTRNIIDYTYSEHGQLLQTIDSNNNTVESYSYDGMGRVVNSTSKQGTITTAYDIISGSKRSIRVENETTGLTTLSEYDQYGRLSSVQSSGDSQSTTTRYYYDQAGRQVVTEAANGARSYTFYNAAGRVSHSVTSEGVVTEYLYFTSGNLKSERTLSNFVSPTNSWYDGTKLIHDKPPGLMPSNSMDRITTYGYNSAGQLTSTTRENGSNDIVSSTSYDGASRITKSSTGNRHTRYYYDKDGNQIGALNAENGLTETVYDSAGRVSSTIRYGEKVPVATWSNLDTVSFSTLKATVNGSGDEKLTTHYFYDDAGRQIGILNEQGYLTYKSYHVTDRTTFTYTYLKPVTYGTGSGQGDTLSELKALAGERQYTTAIYDTFGRIAEEIGIDGTKTVYGYDDAGRLTSKTLAAGSSDETRTRTQYNAFSQVTGYVSGKNDTLLSNLTSAINAYGKRYQYDELGRKVAEHGPQGQKTFFYYDEHGRLTYVINALGEVSTTSYGYFGQAETVSILHTRVNPSGLTGGDAINVKTLVNNARSAAVTKNINVTTEYNQLGLVTYVFDGEGRETGHTYNSYGELYQTTSPNNVVTEYAYDKLGRVSQVRNDKNGINQTTSTTYDAIGRLATTTNNGQTTTHVYEDGGRKITVLDNANNGISTTYDAYGRELTRTDRMGNITRISYDDTYRTTTVTNYSKTGTTHSSTLGDHGVSVTTWKTRTGQTARVRDGEGNITEFTYNKDGALIAKKDALGNVSENTYDYSGRLHEAIDANGKVTRYSYDTANRVLTKSIDPRGLDLTTEYEYDTSGRIVRLTEGDTSLASQHRITEYNYYRDGRLKQETVDPAGLNLSTQYFYDDAGNVEYIKRGDASKRDQQVTQYQYDNLGRKTAEIVDPNGLAITTRYDYDNAGNLSRVQDARNYYTWYVHDDMGRKRYTINAEGYVTGFEYNDNGQIIEQRQYANKVNTATFGKSISFSSFSVTKDFYGDDRSTYNVYNGLGQIRFTLTSDFYNGNDELFVINENRYDGNGNIIEARRYGVQHDLESLIDTRKANGVTEKEVIDYLTYEEIENREWWGSGEDFGNTRRTFYSYDAANRLRFTINAEGQVTESIYDAVGNIIKTVQYDDLLTADQIQEVATDTYYNAGGYSSQWQVYDASPAGATISRVYDSELKQYVAQLQGDATNNGYRLRTNGTADWNNADQKTLSWQMKYSEGYTVYVSVDTNKGHRYLTYNSSGIGKVTYTSGDYIHIGLGDESREGNWFGVTRDLQADANLADPTLIINDVNALLVRGSGYIANVKMHSNAEAVASKIASLKAANSNIETNSRTKEYRYDAANRLVDTLSSIVTVKDNSDNNRTGKIRTRQVFNALSQVVRREEGYIELTNGSNYGDEVRTTHYEYDKAGNQSKITLAGYYWTTSGKVTKNAVGSSSYQRTIETLYDALGNAVRNKTRIGPNSSDFVYRYKAYDSVGRVKYDIDAEGNIKENIYDAKGNVTTAVQYSVKAPSVPSRGYWLTSDSTLTSRLNSDSNERRIINTYDKLGQKLTTTLPNTTNNVNPNTSSSSSPATAATYSGQMKTTFEYNAFGEVAIEKVQINASETANTYRYYDKLGREIATVVQAESNKYYLTRKWYNKLGDITSTKEYANAITSSISLDRIPVVSSNSATDKTLYYYYDNMGRVTSTRQAYVKYVSRSGDDYGNEVSSTKTLSTTNYNAFGEIESQLDALNNTTRFTYNALGQTTQITAPSRLVASKEVTTSGSEQLDPFKNAVNATPITQFNYDIFGNVVYQKQLNSSGARGDYLSTFNQYDHVGNLISSEDPESNIVTYRYNSHGKVIEQKQTITVSSAESPLDYSHQIIRKFEYDKTGRQIATTDVYDGNQTGTMHSYNAFGEVTQEYKISGSASTAITSLSKAIVNYYSYDDAGRVRFQRGSNSGYQFYYYDLQGNVTRKEHRESSSNTTTQRITETVYNRLGHIKLQRLPTIDGTLKPKVSQTTDRWGNVLTATNASGKVTTYTYNNRNQLVSEQGPSELSYDETNTGRSTTVTRSLQYDLAGRQVVEKFTAVRSGVSTLTKERFKFYDNGNNITRDQDATGRGEDYIYDIHGNKVGTRNGVGTVTVLDYNDNGQVIKQKLLRQSPTGSTVNPYTSTSQNARTALTLNEYKYDEAGRQYAATSAGGLTENYKYDARGNIVQKRNVMGVITTYGYDKHGNKISEQVGTEAATTWYYYTDNYRVNQLYWRKYLDNYRHESNSSNRYTSFFYTGFGQLEREQSTEGSDFKVLYTYYKNGLLNTKLDMANKSSTVGRQQTTEYEYDIEGRITRETNTSIDTVEKYSYSFSEEGHAMAGTLDGYEDKYAFNETNYQYDGLGRLKLVSAPAGTFQLRNQTNTTTALNNLTYKYDEWGNRRSVQLGSKIEYYAYDAEGRTLVEKGDIVNGRIVIAKSSTGKAYQYDAAGRLHTTEEFVYAQPTKYGGTQTYNQKIDSYNDLGLLETVKRGSFYRDEGQTSLDTKTATNAQIKETYKYDSRGFRTESIVNNRRSVMIYRNDGQLTQRRNYNSSGTQTSKTYAYQYQSNTGQLLSYTNLIYKSNGYSTEYQDTYSYEYVNTFTGKQVRQINVTRSPSSSQVIDGTTYNRYDHRGRLLQSSFTEYSSVKKKSGTSTKYFSYNAEGKIVSSLSTTYGQTGTKKQTYYYNGNNPIADVGDLGNHFSPINAQHVAGSTPGSHVISQGETLAGIAQSIYGDSSLWYVLAEANALTVGPTDRFSSTDAGRNLSIPNTNQALQNTSTDFKPYNSAEIIGDLTPSVKILPPPKKSCNAFAIIVMAGIAIALTAWLGPLAAQVLQPVLGNLGAAFVGGMIGGAAGSIASQVAGKQMGVIDKINWGSVRTSALTAGVTLGLSEIAQGANTANWIKKALDSNGYVRPAINYVVSTSANEFTGDGSGFSWKGLAAAYAGNEVFKNLGPILNDLPDLMQNTLQGTASGMASAHLKKQWGVIDSYDAGTIAADAFGNALGGYLGSYLPTPAPAIPAYDPEVALAGINGRIGSGLGVTPQPVVVVGSPADARSSTSTADDIYNITTVSNARTASHEAVLNYRLNFHYETHKMEETTTIGYRDAQARAEMDRFNAPHHRRVIDSYAQSINSIRYNQTQSQIVTAGDALLSATKLQIWEVPKEYAKKKLHEIYQLNKQSNIDMVTWGRSPSTPFSNAYFNPHSTRNAVMMQESFAVLDSKILPYITPQNATQEMASMAGNYIDLAYAGYGVYGIVRNVGNLVPNSLDDVVLSGSSRAGANRINTGATEAIRKENCPLCTLGGASSPQRSSSDIADLLRIPENRKINRQGLLDAAYEAGFTDIRRLDATSDIAGTVRALEQYPNGSKFAVSFKLPAGSNGPDAHIFNAYKSRDRIFFKDYQQDVPVFRDSTKVINAFENTDYFDFVPFLLKDGG